MTKKLVTSMSLVVVAGITAMACNPTAPGQTSQNPTGNTSEEELAAAMMTGAPLRCTIVNTEKGDTIEYVTKDKKMKATTTQDEVSYMINDGTYMYVWTEGETTGFKSRIPTEEELAETQEAVQGNIPQSVPDFSQESVQDDYEEQGYTIDCQEGTVTDAEFVPPTTVTFQDFSAMMDGALDAMKKVNEAQ